MRKIWKCEINNSYTNNENWIEIEVVGENFEEALRERFFKVKYRNVKRIDKSKKLIRG
jgi:hypothetical protein